jgi:hypothetical protein
MDVGAIAKHIAKVVVPVIIVSFDRHEETNFGWDIGVAGSNNNTTIRTASTGGVA